ncbi:hypothetical protein L7F22_003796 [Adiantum nelumboides]|nr:hypothetical protein [Adiantum nelumboides]
MSTLGQQILELQEVLVDKAKAASRREAEVQQLLKDQITKIDRLRAQEAKKGPGNPGLNAQTKPLNILEWVQNSPQEDTPTQAPKETQPNTVEEQTHLQSLMEQKIAKDNKAVLDWERRSIHLVHSALNGACHTSSAFFLLRELVAKRILFSVGENREDLSLAWT